MPINILPKTWLDDNATEVVTEGVAGTGCLTILSGDGSKGIPGLDLTAAGAATDKANIGSCMAAILEHMYQHQEAITPAADKPTIMVISRSASSSGATMYVTYSLRFKIDGETPQVQAE
jgi:hypothetical protein